MAVQRHLEKLLKYFYGYLKTNKKTSYTSSKSKWLEIFQMGSGGHLGSMQIARVAQRCHLDSSIEIVNCFKKKKSLIYFQIII